MDYDYLPFTGPGKRVYIRVFYAQAEKSGKKRREKAQVNAEAVTQRRLY